MANKSIHLRIPKELHDRFLEIQEEHGYANIQEFIKEALRTALKQPKTKIEELPAKRYDPY